jgi:biopolymer transport protein ExbD
MGISVGGNRGIFVEMNVVPLIDVLLVLLVIFMIIPHKQTGLTANLPQPATSLPTDPQPEAIVIQVRADGSLRINQESVAWDGLYGPGWNRFWGPGRTVRLLFAVMALLSFRS